MNRISVPFLVVEDSRDHRGRLHSRSAIVSTREQRLRGWLAASRGASG